MLEFIIKMFESDITKIIFAIMVIFFISDLKFKKNFKPVIVSLGIFGTFLGISIGLFNFNIKDISTSVPLLLKGLKTAFTTSVFGMLASIILSIRDKLSETDSDVSSESLLQQQISQFKNMNKNIQLIHKNIIESFHSIKFFLHKQVSQSENMNKNSENINKNIETMQQNMHSSNTLIETLLQKQISQSENMNKNIETMQQNMHSSNTLIETLLQKQVSQFETIHTNIETIHQDMYASNVSVKSLLQKQVSQSENMNKNIEIIHQDISESTKNTKEYLSTIDSTLTEAIDKMSQGATEQIIEALNKVIQDFNNNLTEQFGDNFKQLNEAVFKMIDWQDNYKDSIQSMEQNLQTALDVFNGAKDSLQKNATFTESLTQKYEKISHISEDLSKIIKTNHHQITNLESHMSSLKQTGEDAKLVVKSMDDFCSSIKGSLSEQAQGLKNFQDILQTEGHKYRETLHKDLEKSLGQLNVALTEITNGFRENYKTNISQTQELFKSIQQMLNQVQQNINPNNNKPNPIN